MRDHGYKIMVGNKEENYHANMLKCTLPENGKLCESEKEVFKVIASSEVHLEKEKPSIDKESLLALDTYRQKEYVGDVRLETELNDG